jgi:hypothetical protein
MTQDTAVPEASATVFRFTSGGIDLEFAGSEEFVEKQVDRFRAFLQGAIGIAPAAAPAESAPPGPSQSIDEFFSARPVREKRGAIQDRILLSIYYLQHVQGKREVSGNDILWCFQQLGLETPKNLHNTLGNLKRKLGQLDEGTRRGLYTLSPRGRAYIEGRFQPL